jgi:hypothetical protein
MGEGRDGHSPPGARMDCHRHDHPLPTLPHRGGGHLNRPRHCPRSLRRPLPLAPHRGGSAERPRPSCSPASSDPSGEGSRAGVSAEKRKAPEVRFGPPRLYLDHGTQGTHREGVARSVIGDRHSATVRVTLALVRSALLAEREAIADEGTDDFARREGAERSPRDVRHTVTATKGSSETATSAGTGLPSSASSPTIISRTSRIFASASSRV